MKSIIVIAGLATVTQLLAPAAAQTGKAGAAAPSAAETPAPKQVVVLDPFTLTRVIASAETSANGPIVVLHQHGNRPENPGRPDRPQPRSPHRPDPDHDRGHGNDPDHDDEDNPGQGQGGHGA